MIRIRPAVLSDMAAVAPAMTPELFRARLYQNGGGPVWTATHKGQPIATGGLVLVEQGLLDIWMDVKTDLPPSLKWPLVRAMIRHLRSQPSYGTIRAAISEADGRAQRMSLMAGFLPTNSLSTDGAFRSWVKTG